jgi:hypothetical protein
MFANVLKQFDDIFNKIEATPVDRIPSSLLDAAGEVSARLSATQPTTADELAAKISRYMGACCVDTSVKSQRLMHGIVSRDYQAVIDNRDSLALDTALTDDAANTAFYAAIQADIDRWIKNHIIN